MGLPFNDRIGAIYYVIPDLHRPDLNLMRFLRAVRQGKGLFHLKKYVFRKHKPVGGVKVMYQHCLMLRELGYNAHLLKMGEYEGNFFDYPITAKSIDEVGFNLNSTDVVVCPEFLPYLGLQFKNAKRVLFAQASRPLYKTFKPLDVGKSYKALGYDKLLYCSEYLKAKLYREVEQDLHLVDNYIDHSKFKVDPSARIKNRVMALPRKNPDDLVGIMKRVKHSQADFHLVDGLPEPEIIKEYQASDIFLATGYPEGFGLPPMEAMACGAAVVGFTGGGGSEFMKDGETALVVPDGDVDAAAAALERLLASPSLKEKIRARGYEMAQTYNLQAAKAQLANFFASFFPVGEPELKPEFEPAGLRRAPTSPRSSSTTKEEGPLA